MVSVTARIKQVKQPFGGYINPKMMHREDFDDGIALGPESISPTTMGMVVDYMTRFKVSGDAEDAFRISIQGAIRCGRLDEAMKYLSKIKGLDDDSIRNACRLTWFDVVLRTGMMGPGAPTDIVPDAQTCENVRTMVGRSMAFFEKYGPIVCEGMTFPGGYSKVVNTGDGDFATKDTLWDFKVSKNPPTKENTLQLAMYYIMAKRSAQEWSNDIDKIGIFNPRLNAVFILKMSEVPGNTIESIEREALCYD